MLKGGLSNSIAKITECEESFITNNSKKNHEGFLKQESRNSIKEQIQMFEGSQEQQPTYGNHVGPWNTNHRESNTQGALRKKGRQHQLQFPRMGVKIKGAGQTIINESESSGLRTTRDNGERLNPIQQWSPDVGSSQGFSSRYSKESINDIKAQNPQNNIKLSNYRMASKITLPTSGGEDITSSMQQTKTQIQVRERFDSDANHQQKDFIITNGFQARLFSEQNKRQTQGGENGISNKNNQIQTNNLIQRKITTSGNDMPLGQGNPNRYIMTSRDQQKFFRNPKNHVYLKDLDTKSSKLIHPLNRTNFKAFPATSRHLGESPSQHIFHSDNKLQNEIQSAFDSFENREKSVVYNTEDPNLIHDALEIGNQEQDDQAHLVSKVKLVQPLQQNKKTLLHSSNRNRQMASVKQERKFKMNSYESIESVFAQRSIEKMILKRTSFDINQKSHINLNDQQNELQIPRKVNDKNEEAFGITMLKQFPNGSISKEIYRSKANNQNNQRLKSQNTKIKLNQNGSLDTIKNTVQEEQNFTAEVNSFADLQPSISGQGSSEWTKDSTQKAPYHLSLQRDRKEKKKNQAAANKSLYINIKQSNLNKDSAGLLRRAQQENLQRLLQKFSDSDSKPTLSHQTMRLNEFQGMEALAQVEFQTDSMNPSQQIESGIPSIDTTAENQSSSQRGLFSNKHISYKTIQISGCDGEDQLPSHYTSIQLDANTSTREEDMNIHQLNQDQLKPVGMDTIVANSSKTHLLKMEGLSFRDQEQTLGQFSRKEPSYENQNEIQSLEYSSASKIREGSLQMEVSGIAEALESRRNSKLTQQVSTRVLDFKQEKQILDLIKTVESKTVHLEGDLKAITGAHIDFKDDKSCDVLNFFRERDNWVKNIFNQHFRNNCFAEKYGLPKVVEDLLIAVVEALRSDQAEFTKYLQMRKQVADFQSQQMYSDMQTMSKELSSFQGKDQAYQKYRDRLFDPGCTNKMDDELIGDLEHYDEMEGVQDYEVPSKFDFNDKVSNAKVSLQKALDSVGKLSSTDVEGLVASETSVESLPFEYLQQLLNKKTTAVQKKTAYKVLQRYFRNIKTRDMGVTCDLDEDLLRRQVDLKARVAQLKEENDALLADKIKLSGEVERAVVQIGKVKTELILQANKVEDAEQQTKIEKQKYADIEKSLEAALKRKQKQNDDLTLQTQDIETKYITVQKESVVLTSEVQVKKVKIVQKAEKIVTMRKDHKKVKVQLKEEKKEVKSKLTETKNILKMLKQGLISIADIQNVSDVEDSQSSSESEQNDASDEEIIKQAQADPEIKEAVQKANIQKKNELIRANIAKRMKKAKKAKSGGAEEEEIDYGSDGQQISRKQKKKKVKRKDAQGNSVTVSESSDESEPGQPGTARRNKSKKNKQKRGYIQADESSEEEIEVIENGLKVKKVIKKTKQIKQVEGIDYVYETDPVTGAQKKVTIKNSFPNSKGEVFVDDGYVSQYSYKQSEQGTILRRKKKIRQPGQVPGDSSDFEQFDEDQAKLERQENRISLGLNPEAQKVTITNEIKQALLNKFKGKKPLSNNQEYNSQGEFVGKGENTQGRMKNGVQMFGSIGSGDNYESREGTQGFNGGAINQMMPRKYSNFDKNGMKIKNSNTKESQTQISGPVIQSDLTESLFNKIDDLEKQAAQLTDLKKRQDIYEAQRRQEVYVQQQLVKQHEENKIQEMIKKQIKQKFEKSASPVKRMNTSFVSSNSRGRLLKGSRQRIIVAVDSQDREQRESIIRGLVINTTQKSHVDTSLTPTRQGNNLNDISAFSQNSGDPNFSHTLQPKTAVNFTKEVLSDEASPIKVSMKTRRTVAFESFDHRQDKANNSLMREDIVEESEVSLGND